MSPRATLRLLFLLSLLLLPSSSACIDAFPAPRCRTDRDCPLTSTRCNTTTNICEVGLGSGCLRDADCAQNKVCDAKNTGLCFDKCKDDSDCAEGDLCDLQSQRCRCAQRECARRDGGGKFGCHPLLRICAVRCATTSQCDAGEACMGPADNQHCISNPRQLKHGCNTNADCRPATPICDTQAIPRRCVHAPVTSCTNDSSCINNRRAKFCHKGQCVVCLADDDCLEVKQRCQADKTCR